MSKDYWKDNNGYPHSTSIHRQIAYKKIYLKNRNKYPLPFSKYVVHHIDTNPENFDEDNLYICTEEEHNTIHKEQKKNLKKFKNKRELDKFLQNYIPKGQKTLKDKKYRCLGCGRKLSHKGFCLVCNVKRKDEDYLELIYKPKKNENYVPAQYEPKKPKSNAGKIIIIIALIFVLYFIFNGGDNTNKYENLINLSYPMMVEHTPEITAFCKMRCGSNELYDADIFYATSDIRCNCDNIPLLYYDLKTKRKMTVEEVRERGAYYEKYK